MPWADNAAGIMLCKKQVKKLRKDNKRMSMTNIKYIMDMTKSFLAGEIDSINYYLDFPFEVEKRYQKMIREDREYADLIFECLVEEGIGKFDDLSDAQFTKLIKKQYTYIQDVASEGFLYEREIRLYHWVLRRNPKY